MKQYECCGIKQVITTVRRLTGLKIHKEEASLISSLCKDLRKSKTDSYFHLDHEYLDDQGKEEDGSLYVAYDSSRFLVGLEKKEEPPKRGGHQYI